MTSSAWTAEEWDCISHMAISAAQLGENRAGSLITLYVPDDHMAYWCTTCTYMHRDTPWNGFCDLEQFRIHCQGEHHRADFGTLHSLVQDASRQLDDVRPSAILQVINGYTPDQLNQRVDMPGIARLLASSEPYSDPEVWAQPVTQDTDSVGPLYEGGDDGHTGPASLEVTPDVRVDIAVSTMVAPIGSFASGMDTPLHEMVDIAQSTSTAGSRTSVPVPQGDEPDEATATEIIAGAAHELDAVSSTEREGTQDGESVPGASSHSSPQNAKRPNSRGPERWTANLPSIEEHPHESAIGRLKEWSPDYSVIPAKRARTDTRIIFHSNLQAEHSCAMDFEQAPIQEAPAANKHEEDVDRPSEDSTRRGADLLMSDSNDSSDPEMNGLAVPHGEANCVSDTGAQGGSTGETRDHWMMSTADYSNDPDVDKTTALDVPAVDRYDEADHAAAIPLQQATGGGTRAILDPMVDYSFDTDMEEEAEPDVSSVDRPEEGFGSDPIETPAQDAPGENIESTSPLPVNGSREASLSDEDTMLALLDIFEEQEGALSEYVTVVNRQRGTIFGFLANHLSRTDLEQPGAPEGPSVEEREGGVNYTLESPVQRGANVLISDSNEVDGPIDSETPLLFSQFDGHDQELVGFFKSFLHGDDVGGDNGMMSYMANLNSSSNQDRPEESVPDILSPNGHEERMHNYVELPEAAKMEEVNASLSDGNVPPGSPNRGSTNDDSTTLYSPTSASDYSHPLDSELNGMNMTGADSETVVGEHGYQRWAYGHSQRRRMASYTSDSEIMDTSSTQDSAAFSEVDFLQNAFESNASGVDTESSSSDLTTSLLAAVSESAPAVTRFPSPGKSYGELSDGSSASERYVHESRDRDIDTGSSSHEDGSECSNDSNASDSDYTMEDVWLGIDYQSSFEGAQSEGSADNDSDVHMMTATESDALSATHSDETTVSPDSQTSSVDGGHAESANEIVDMASPWQGSVNASTPDTRENSEVLTYSRESTPTAGWSKTSWPINTLFGEGEDFEPV
ncbi:hypothetical protein K474DRAFT_1674311 [Panus rudis PR-1116 ss-1]|nr:hypothetical protein K474DRAFT_1674311 [Panus rudis PR-1116 ss-1]